MINRVQLKEAAKAQIKGKIGVFFLISLIYYAIYFAASFIPVVGGLVASIFLLPSFSFSFVLISLKFYSGDKIEVGNVFDGFHYFWGAFKITFLSGLFTFLWSLLLIVPGVIKAYSYSMALFIYAENPEMGALEAIKKSQEMMNGHKMDLFVLELSFLGWALLTVITFGIVGIYLTPYMLATTANFYKAISVPACSCGCSESGPEATKE